MELEAHIEAMPALRADRLLDGAQVAAYPLYLQHAQRHAQDWWRRLVAQAQDTVSAAVQRATGRKPMFLFNGMAIEAGALKRKLGEALGRGLVA